MKRTIRIDAGEPIQVGQHKVTLLKTGKHSERGGAPIPTATLEIIGPDAQAEQHEAVAGAAAEAGASA